MAKRKPAHGHIVHSKTPPPNHCFACGKDNPDGMHLKFYLDETAGLATCTFTLSKRYQGPPGHAHGGIIATLLDEAMGKVNKLRNVIALTKQMSVEYLKPVPLGAKLTVTAKERQVQGREHTNVAEISNADGLVLARSSGTFIAVDVTKKFAAFLEKAANPTSKQ